MRPIRIANCSGFYGDRLSAVRDMLAGPEPIDVLTGDYLAELTMLILWKAKQRDPASGFARTFLTQMEESLETCMRRGVKIVTNAGGLNPQGLADKLEEIAAHVNLPVKIAIVEGDDIAPRVGDLLANGEEFRHLDTGQSLADSGVEPVTANAYLGGWGIAKALELGADIVICGRVSDASLVVGPAAWWHGWHNEEWDKIAGAVAAGHIIECGAQTTGGNYPFLDEVGDDLYPGFPIAEVAQDGSCVITKQPGTAGAVTVGTVTAQLLYEIAGGSYPNPDVVARFDTIALSQAGDNRVLVRGAQGEPAPDQLKVALNYSPGFRNSMTMVLTGLDIEAKARRAEALLFELLGGREQFGEVAVQLVRTDKVDAASNEEASAQLRVTVKDPDSAKVGRRFSNAVTELALASYAGFYTLTPPGPENAYGVYWPALIDAQAVQHRLVLWDKSEHVIAHPKSAPPNLSSASSEAPGSLPAEPTTSIALGRLCGARSGDKGGNGNVGVWCWDPEVFSWLRQALTVDRFREIMPEAAPLEVRRYEFANLMALNFVVVGLLGEGVASSVRFDGQAKSLGEFIRSRWIDVPTRLLGNARSA